MSGWTDSHPRLEEASDNTELARDVPGLRAYAKAIGHRGGRLLWHLKDSGDLLVRWRTCAAGEADSAETAAIACFKEAHDGRRPFANRNK
jgi:hypothetical protein